MSANPIVTSLSASSKTRHLLIDSIHLYIHLSDKIYIIQSNYVTKAWHEQVNDITKVRQEQVFDVILGKVNSIIH